ncbi:MAG: DUF3054 family protein [Chloroflexi bacterium]|nr:DUF3054 family protein [Chloroflexota bacterium]
MHLSSRARWALVIGDLIALLLFLAGGQAQHNTVNAENPLLGLLLLGSYYAPVWLVTAWLVNAYATEHAAARVFMARSLNAWLIAAPLATLARALLLGSAVIPVPFLLVTLGVGGAIVLGWRLLYGVVILRRAR